MRHHTAIRSLEPAAGTPDARVMLGKSLFHDPRLSSDNSLSCGSCHDVTNGGDDGRPRSIGVNGAEGPINAPTVLNSSLNFASFWDGRSRSLEEQVDGPVHNPKEMASNWPQVLEKLRADTALVSRFEEVYPDGLTAENIKSAIAAYERALITPSPFDDYLRGNSVAISEEAKRGYARFQEMGCASCHQGINLGGNLFQRFGVMGNYMEDHREPTLADMGRYNVTGQESDRYRFKVPSLRNVSVTAPYFHDGSAETLDEAVRIMIRYQLGMVATDEDVHLLVEFLNCLRGELPPELAP